MRVRLLLLLPILLAAACGGDAAGGPLVERLDSAGVPVFVNAVSDSTSPVWRLSSAPLVEIGTVDGPEAYQLFRVSSGALFPGGRVVIANGGTRQLRLYDEAGTHIRSVGGEGQGPGQFGSISLLGGFAGDSLLVWDAQQRRASVFGPDGAFARSYSGPSELGVAPIIGGVLADGRMVALNRVLAAVAGMSGLQRNPQTVITVGVDGATGEALGEFPGAEESVFEGLGMGVIFGRRLHFHARGDRVAVGNDDTYSVRIYGADGHLLHVVRQARVPIPVGDNDFEAAAPPVIPTSPIQARLSGALEQMPRHATFPAYQDLRLGVGDRLWIQDFVRPGEEGATWHAFGPDGAYRARLDLPRATDVLDFGEDQVLVRVRDDLGVERVRVYGLER